MKKIDIAKSTILGVGENDVDGLKLGISGYFSHYSDFETYVEGELDGFTYSEFMSSQEDPDGDYGDQWYDYFIPEDKVVFEEETIVPYFHIKQLPFKVGDVLTIKKIGYDLLIDTVVTNIWHKEDGTLKFLVLGNTELDFDTLLKEYQFINPLNKNEKEWLKFGIEE